MSEESGSNAIKRRFEHFELGAMFFLNAAAMGMWSVPLSNVLKAHGYEKMVPWAFACSAVSALVSPMVFGALADQRISPTKLVRWLATLTAVFLALTYVGIEHHWRMRWVLVPLQIQALFAAPTMGLATAVVMARLRDPSKEFGPVRAFATLGWMLAGIFVSWVLRADTSVLSGYAAAITWVISGLSTLLLPDVPPLEVKEHRTWRDVFGLQALELFAQRDHRVVFLTAALFNMPMAAFYPYASMQLRDLGVDHAAGTLSLGQVSELISMFGLGLLFVRVRLKWIFLAGIVFGIARYALFALNMKTWLIAGIALHGFAFTLYFITAQIYLEQRVDSRIRARAQALLGVMVGGVGNLAGYLGNGWWKGLNTTRISDTESLTNWPLFWMGLTAMMVAVFAYFAINYRGQLAAKETVPSP
jgi:MFS family permease